MGTCLWGAGGPTRAGGTPLFSAERMPVLKSGMLLGRVFGARQGPVDRRRLPLFVPAATIAGPSGRICPREVRSKIGRLHDLTGSMQSEIQKQTLKRPYGRGGEDESKPRWTPRLAGSGMPRRHSRPPVPITVRLRSCRVKVYLVGAGLTRKMPAGRRLRRSVPRYWKGASIHRPGAKPDS